jgi:predicted Fe-Mo cluster-binding NifX family protein
MKKAVLIILVLVSFLTVHAFGAQPMKIAVAATDKTPAATVSNQTGGAAYFLFFDGKGKFLEAIKNPYKDAESPGPSVANYLSGKGAKVVVAGFFGPKIADIMKAKGMTPFSFNGTAQEAVKKVLQTK